jgi:hypothetical protein
LQLLAGKVVELGILDNISAAAIGNRLKKNEIKLRRREQWCIPKPSDEFVERMEDVLSVYTLPYQENRPVICLDETNRQLIGEITSPFPPQPGQAAVYDYEYVRNGAADLFMLFEPLAAQRQVMVTQTKVDFAGCLSYLSDRLYPHAEKIILVMDNANLRFENTHSLASLYTAFPRAEARRLAERFEIHHTPKHASWLNMAEIEIGVMSRQCLSRRIPTMEEMTSQVKAWAVSRNKRKDTVHGQFTTQDARKFRLVGVRGSCGTLVKKR